MNKASQILGGAAVIAIAIVFIVQFNPSAGQQVRSADTTCAVEVRGDCIPAADFTAARGLLGFRNTGIPQFRKLILDGLYERWLLNEDAKRLGITASDSDVTVELRNGRFRASLPVDQIRQIAGYLFPQGSAEQMVQPVNVRNRQTGKFDQKTYERMVRSVSRMSEVDFREFQKKELIAARMRDLIRARVHVGENEARQEFSRQKTTRTIAYVRLDKRFYKDIVIDASDKAVSAWASQNAEELDKAWEANKSKYLPECRVAREIFVELAPDAGDMDAQKAAAKPKIEQALERIKKGEDFAAVAKQVSNSSTAPGDGALGCVTKGHLDKPVEDQLFQLEQGKHSEIIETDKGFYLLRLDKIAKDAEAESLGKKQIARERYLAYESERLAAEGAKQLLASVGSGKTLQEALDSYLEPIMSSTTDDETKDKKPNVTDKPAEGSQNDAEPMTAANHPQRPIVETSLPFNATGYPITEVKPGTDVAQIAFRLDKPLDVPKDIVPLDQGYAVIQLKEITPISQEQWDKERESYMSSMKAYKQYDALAAYIRRLKSTIGSEVKFDQRFLKEDSSEAPLDDEP